MTTEAAVLVRSFRDGKRTVTWTIPKPRPGSVMHSATAWDPDLPMHLSKCEWSDYRAGRDAIYTELSALLGTRIAIIEL